MRVEELYETALWQQLSKNGAFLNKFNEVINRCNYYVRSDDIKISIKDGRLVASYITPIRERELNCEEKSEVYFDFYIDEEENLVINEKSGTLRSNYGFDFINTVGGVLDTHYSCNVFDPDGIELAYQGYNDTISVDKKTFDVFKDGFSGAIDTPFNPKLDRYANSMGAYLKADVIGSNPRYFRQIRSKDNLGIVICNVCQFDQTGKVINPSETYYFNSFMSEQSAMRPEMINYSRSYPMAVIDEKGMHFSSTYTDSGLTQENYKEVAKTRFLKELQEEQQMLGRHVPKEVEDKYDLMIDRMQKSIDKGKGTI